jgi:uncharacterized membrane protein (UPF0127 family)
MTSRKPINRKTVSGKALAVVILFSLGWVVAKSFAIHDDQTTGHSSALPVAIAHTQSGSLELQIANTATEREKGLQGVPKLLPGHGVLFLTEKPQIPKMWMRHVEIPLDMVFVRNGTVTDVKAHVPPCLESTIICPTYSPKRDVDAVIEVGAGEAERLGLTVGAKVDIPNVPGVPKANDAAESLVIERNGCSMLPTVCGKQPTNFYFMLV